MSKSEGDGTSIVGPNRWKKCMTLFAHATSDNLVFEDALLKYFEGQYDPLSLERMEA